MYQTVGVRDWEAAEEHRRRTRWGLDICIQLVWPEGQWCDIIIGGDCISKRRMLPGKFNDENALDVQYLNGKAVL